MPWYGSTRRSELIDRIASCTCTCELLELYGEDIPRSKFLIRTTLYLGNGTGRDCRGF
jgi:hypothetical protein